MDDTNRITVFPRSDTKTLKDMVLEGERSYPGEVQLLPLA